MTNQHNNPEPIEDLLALYALGGLDAAEQRLVEEYVAANPTAEAHLAELQATANLLPLAAVPLPPSAEMSEQLFQRVERNASARFAPRPTRPVVAKQTTPTLSWWERLFGRPSVALGGLVLAAMAFAWAAVLLGQVQQAEQSLASVTAENAQLTSQNAQIAGELTAATTQNAALQQQLITLQTELATEEAIVNLVSSPASYRITLPGTELNPEAQGQLLYNPEKEVAILLVADLPPLETGLVYQVLLIRDDGHDTAETFTVSTEGNGVLVVHSAEPLNTFTAVGVSIEPAGGSFQRTGEIVLLGNLMTN